MSYKFDQLRYAIIDDNESIEKIKEHLQDFPRLIFSGKAENAATGLALLMSDSYPDLLFLNIDLEGSLQLLNQLGSNKTSLQVILTSNTTDRAIEGLDSGATGYLTKPIDPERLFKTASKAIELLDQVQRNDYCFMPSERKMTKIIFAKISYIEASGNYVKIVTADKNTILVSVTLEKLETKLNDRFARIHRSFIVNLDRIEHLMNNQVEMDNGGKIKITRTYRQALLKRLPLLSATITWCLPAICII